MTEGCGLNCIIALENKTAVFHQTIVLVVLAVSVIYISILATLLVLWVRSTNWILLLFLFSTLNVCWLFLIGVSLKHKAYMKSYLLYFRKPQTAKYESSTESCSEICYSFNSLTTVSWRSVDARRVCIAQLDERLWNWYKQTTLPDLSKYSYEKSVFELYHWHLYLTWGLVE